LPDATDFAATFATRERLPQHGVRLALLLAGFGSAAGSAAAIWLASAGDGDSQLV